MHILFLDLASHDHLFAVVNAQRVISSLPIKDHKDEQELMNVLDKVIADAGLTLADLTHIACVLGPGGFTTLRVGVSMANALSYALDIPSTGIHLSDLWQQRVDQQDFVWLHSTRKTELFVRGFGQYAEKWPEPVLASLDELADEIWGVAWVGELLPEHETRLLETRDSRLETRNVSLCTSESLVSSLASRLLSYLPSLSYQKQTLTPWYGRKW